MKPGPFILVAFALAIVVACTHENPTAARAPTVVAAPVTAIATTRQIMLAITAPTSDVVFKVGADAPAGDSEWEKLEANALALAESGNLLRAEARLIDREDWTKYAAALAEIAQSAARAAYEPREGRPGPPQQKSSQRR